jgi:carbamate kinase
MTAGVRAGAAVVAVGGNALTRPDQLGSAEQIAANAAGMAATLAGLVAAGRRVAVVHGNGPQVGNLALQQDALAATVPAQPLHQLSAMTQGQLGGVLARAIDAACGAGVAVCVVTHVAVDPDDPAFEHLTKPIGPFLDRRAAEEVAAQRGWQVVEDAGRGWRRVVPSPKPVRVVELDAIAALVRAGFTVIAGGGGGIPVVEEPDGSLLGVEAVVDKDYLSAVLAAGLGADLLVLTTGVPQVAVNFGRPDQRFLDRIDLDEAREHLADGQFPPGSMGPKVSAAIQFLETGGGEALITSPDLLADALAGRTGTRIVARALAGQGGG